MTTIPRSVAFGLWLAAGLLVSISLMMAATAHAQDGVVPARVSPGDQRPAAPILLSVEVVPEGDERAAAKAEPCDPRVERCAPSPSAPDTTKPPAP